MNKKINHSSIEEILRDELISLKSFEGDRSLPLSCAERIKNMEEYDPGGVKAHELAKRYQAE